MSMFEKIAMWWKSMTPADKFGTVFKGISTVACCVGAGCCIHEVRKSHDILDFAVDNIGNGVDVSVSEDLINSAVEKATQAQINKAVASAVSQNWTDIQKETVKEVREAVEKKRAEIAGEVSNTLAKECEKIHKADILNDIREKAKDALAEKLDSKLDDITDEYSNNLNNMGKVYQALADKLSTKA